MTAGDIASIERAPVMPAAAVPGVARMAGGRWGEAVTYHRGGRSVGVQVRDGVVSVHVVVDALPIDAVAARVRRAVRSALQEAGYAQRVDVVIEDIEMADLP